MIGNVTTAGDDVLGNCFVYERFHRISKAKEDEPALVN